MTVLLLLVALTVSTVTLSAVNQVLLLVTVDVATTTVVLLF